MDGPSSVTIQESYRGMEIPAWMDFPEEEETWSSEEWDSEGEGDDSGDEEGDSEEEEKKETTDSEEEEESYRNKLKRKMCIAWLLAKKEFSKKIDKKNCKEEAFPMIQEAEIRNQEAEKRRAWWPPSAEEQSRARGVESLRDGSSRGHIARGI
jgi:hypothetical protein